MNKIKELPKDTAITKHYSKYFRNRELKELLKNIKNYKWQFWGYINKKGEKVLSIVSFDLSDDELKPPHDSWLKDEVGISDGGCEYWHALYNLNTGEIILFSCNGEA
jgi:hypothetical protein